MNVEFEEGTLLIVVNVCGKEFGKRFNLEEVNWDHIKNAVERLTIKLKAEAEIENKNT